MTDVTITIDGRQFTADDRKNVLEVALSLGFDLPYFCWHPAMGSVGACRQCAVKLYWDEKDTEGEIAMACMTTVRDGLRVEIDDPEARLLRASVIEGLMMSHPHDCPVCDEGGECHLQDMTVMTGHTYRRYRFKKRTFENQDLGPFVTHEMNRCIQCYRCVRFYNDYAGGHDFGQQMLRDLVYFGRFEDGALESEFSGNLIEVCPVGVFDDKTLAQHYTRKWDMQNAPSVCVHCARGCNIILGERYGMLRRVRNRYNHEVNGYFICDRGRFGYEFVNQADGRLLHPLDRSPSSTHRAQAGAKGAAAEDIPETAAERILGRLARAFNEERPVIGVGSPRASLEANFALRRLVGPDHFYLGVSDEERELLDLVLALYRSGLRPPALTDLDAADMVLVLGEDITNAAPMLAFSIRKWLRLRPTEEEERLRILRWNDYGVGAVKAHEPSALWSAVPYRTKLDEVSRKVLYAPPSDIARAALTVAHAFDEDVAAPDSIGEVGSDWAQAVGQALRGAERVVIVAGTTCGSRDVLLAAAALARALPQQVWLALIVPEVNSLGLVTLGGGFLSEALGVAADDGASAAIVLENDLERRVGGGELRAFVAACPYVVAIDSVATATTDMAHAVLPSTPFAQSAGTFVSHEGRAQRFFAVCRPEVDDIRDAWRWLAVVARDSGRWPERPWQGLDDVLAALAAEVPHLAAVRDVAPPSGFRIDDMKVARLARRQSGRTAMHAPRHIVEPQPPSDPDSPLAYTTEAFQGQPPSSLLTRNWAPGWNSVQALNKLQEEVAGPLRQSDPGRRLFDGPAGGGEGGEDPLEGLVVPPAFEAAEGEWLVLPMQLIYGSEELSMRAPGVAGRAPAPFIALSREDAAALEGEHGSFVTLEWGGYRAHLPVRVLEGLVRGLAALPVGLPELAGIVPPFRARLHPGGGRPHA